jgi:hypothetical protein
MKKFISIPELRPILASISLKLNGTERTFIEKLYAPLPALNTSVLKTRSASWCSTEKRKNGKQDYLNDI